MDKVLSDLLVALMEEFGDTANTRDALIDCGNGKHADGKIRTFRVSETFIAGPLGIERVATLHIGVECIDLSAHIELPVAEISLSRPSPGHICLSQKAKGVLVLIG